MKVTILGCGGSGGVPLATGSWGQCNPANPKNRRRRVSILVEHGGTAVLVDTSPDLRQQCLDAGIRRLDAILYTHDHADHCHGIDELRAFIPTSAGNPIDAYGSSITMAALRHRFAYAFEPREALYRPLLTAKPIADAPFEVGTMTVTPFDQDHGFGAVTTGYRIGGMAYSTDLVDIPVGSRRILRDLDLWIVDCLRYEPHPTHAHFEMTLGWIRELRPKRAVLTHLNHSLDYDELASRCPVGVEPGFDGMIIDL